MNSFKIFIVEDDPYGDLYFTDNEDKYKSIKSLGNDVPIIYISSFSKILCPGFRLSWMVADDIIIDTTFTYSSVKSTIPFLVNIFREKKKFTPTIIDGH